MVQVKEKNEMVKLREKESGDESCHHKQKDV